MKGGIHEKDLGYKKIRDDLIAMNAYTSVGVHEDAGDSEGTPLAVIAAVHEYGAEIKNGFGKGIRIVIPERSFLRSFVDENSGNLENFKQKIVGMIIDGKSTPGQALSLLGEYAVSGVKKKMRNGPFTPLRPATIRRKGSSKPLIDTGQLIGSISHKEIYNKPIGGTE